MPSKTWSTLKQYLRSFLDIIANMAWFYNLRAKRRIRFVRGEFLMEGLNASVCTTAEWVGARRTVRGHGGYFDRAIVTLYVFLVALLNNSSDLAFRQLVSSTDLCHIDHTVFQFAELSTTMWAGKTMVKRRGGVQDITLTVGQGGGGGG